MQEIIRAVDFVPTIEDRAENMEELGVDPDNVVLRLFGITLDYTNPKFEQLWQEVLDGDNEENIKYCLEKGIDVLDNEKQPIQRWRDIVVVLKAIDKGLLQRK
ncbi:MAG: hypothetical protein MJ250_04385 [Alphaproteobacteria bacterium]|nr:hypothetical protein [Alphaproteobacteria bacterium]